MSNVKHHADALVLEMVYPTLEQAVQNRLQIHLGTVGKLLTPLLLWQIKPRLDFKPNQLTPINEINKVAAPVMIISGGKDIHTPIAESEELFKKAMEPKVKWVLEDAVHQNFYDYSPNEYERRVSHFFHQHLITPNQKR